MEVVIRLRARTRVLAAQSSPSRRIRYWLRSTPSATCPAAGWPTTSWKPGCITKSAFTTEQADCSSEYMSVPLVACTFWVSVQGRPNESPAAVTSEVTNRSVPRAWAAWNWLSQTSIIGTPR